MLKVGMLTSGGDCQALNATMRGVYKAVTNNAKEPVEFYGFEDGYKGLMYGKFRLLNDDDIKGFLGNPDTGWNNSWYIPSAVQTDARAG